MKKILLLFTGIALIFLGFQTSYAVPMEKNLEFNITSIDDDTNYPNLNVIGNTSTSNLYEEIASHFPIEVEGPSLTDSLDITITKDGISYPAVLTYKVLTGSGFPNMYDISTNINGWQVRFEFWDGTYTYEDKTVLSTQVDIFANDLMIPNKLNSLKGIWKITGTVDTVPNPNDGINVSNNFNLIPNTIGTLIDADVPNMVGFVYFDHVDDNLFDVFILLGGSQYNLGQLELPGVSELGKMPLNPGIYWTENNKRHIYYEFQQPPSEVPINDQLNLFLSDIEQIKGFRPFVSMNLTDSTYKFTDKLLLYAGYYGGPNSQAYADVVFPFELDDLLSIEFNYMYRYQNLWGLGGYTPWEEVNITRYINEAVMLVNTWQAIKTAMSPLALFSVFENVNSWADYSINKLSPTEKYKADYTAHLNRVRTSQSKPALSQSQVFPVNSDVYRVYLDTFYNPGHTGYEIHDDIIIMDVMYQVDGVVYHVAYDDIEQGGSFGGGGPGLGGQDRQEWNWNWLTSIFDNIPTQYILIGLAVVLVAFWKPIKKGINNIKSLIQNPKDLLIFGAILAALMYFLGYL